MLETLKSKVKDEITTLKDRIQHNRDLIEKRSRKTLDIIEADEKTVKAYEADLEALESLTAKNTEKVKQ